ncbi:iron-containing redox enzyme family protein [Streptomyces sp. NBC_00029]|uniref:iron-containing redox enzyme family protein n=1 Tax=Streptomyces sp. NBC_00029 TaxID=2903613 RepID=UPI00324E11B7
MTPPSPTVTDATTTAGAAGPRLVAGRGELSGAVTRALRSGTAPVYAPGAVLKADPWGEDLQLSLHLLYELHYRGFDGVDGEREWDPDLLRLRQALEARFLHALRTELSDAPRSVEEAFAPLLATVNLMSLFGLHRAMRGALVGHFACVEVTSSPGSRRLARAMRRCGAGPAAEHFYAEHVEADAVHEQVVRHEVIGGLLADEPELEGDVAFGCAATVLVEDRLAAHIRGAWDSGRSALRTALPEH